MPSTHLTAGSLTIKSTLPPLAGPQPAASVPASRLFAPAPAATADSSAPAATADYTARAIADYTARAPDELRYARVLGTRKSGQAFLRAYGVWMDTDR